MSLTFRSLDSGFLVLFLFLLHVALEYDPTMDFLFIDTPTDKAELAAGTNVAAAVAVPVVIVVIVAVCISYFLYKKHVNEKATKLVREKLAGANKTPSGSSASSPSSPAASEPKENHSRTSSTAWQKTRLSSTV